jgi:hypothetical protein
VLNVNGEHVEVWCVPSATLVPGVDQSQNKIKAFLPTNARFIKT